MYCHHPILIESHLLKETIYTQIIGVLNVYTWKPLAYWFFVLPTPWIIFNNHFSPIYPVFMIIATKYTECIAVWHSFICFCVDFTRFIQQIHTIVQQMHSDEITFCMVRLQHKTKQQLNRFYCSLVIIFASISSDIFVNDIPNIDGIALLNWTITLILMVSLFKFEISILLSWL